MNNYDEIALDAVKNVLGEEYHKEFCSDEAFLNSFIYKCAHEAAKLQAERFNKDLDDSYIESLSKEELC